MIQVCRYREGEEEILRQLCRETTLKVNVVEYGDVLVKKWTSRLDSRDDWHKRVKFKNPFVADVDGEVVGFAELTKTGNISAFYCHHLWQKRGVGCALFEAIEAEAKNLEIEVIQVESSVSASSFFIKMGFKVAEEKTTLTDGISSKSVVLKFKKNR